MYKKIKKTMAVVLCAAITVTTLQQNMIIIKADEISDTIDNNDNEWQSEEYTHEHEDISEASSEDIKENTDEDIVKDNEQTDENISDSDVTDEEQIIKNEYTAYTFTKWIICISAPYVLITS